MDMLPPAQIVALGKAELPGGGVSVETVLASVGGACMRMLYVVYSSGLSPSSLRFSIYTRAALFLRSV